MASSSPQSWEGKAELQKYYNVSHRAINSSARRLLARALDPPKETFTMDGVPQDWEGLADLMGFDIEDIQGFRNKTMSVIDSWSIKPNATIGGLLTCLEQLERYDILEDEGFRKSIERGVLNYQQNQEEKDAFNNSGPVQVDVISSHVGEPCMIDDHNADEFRNITIGEVRTGQPEYFDAFVCYTDSDMPFVHNMIQMLERVHGLKMCVPDRDIIPGCAKYPVYAHLVEKRCRKLVIILSPEYFNSDSCDFLTKFGQALAPGAKSKKLIPVLIKNPSPIPGILRYITLLDFTKCDVVEWFWERMAQAIKAPTHMVGEGPAVPDVGQDDPMEVHDSGISLGQGASFSGSVVEAPSGRQFGAMAQEAAVASSSRQRPGGAQSSPRPPPRSSRIRSQQMHS